MALKKYQALTLIETLLAITIFTMGVAGFTMLFSRTWRNNSYTLEMGQSSMAVSQGMNTMVNYIRGARQADDGSFAIESANDNDLVLYSDYDKDGITERLHFYKNGQNILMGVTDPTAAMPRSYPDEDQQIVTLAGHIVNDANSPVFYYYDKNFAGDEAANLFLRTPVTVSNIRLIKIHLQINIVPNRAPDNIEMQSFVEMRNLNDYDRLH